MDKDERQREGGRWRRLYPLSVIGCHCVRGVLSACLAHCCVMHFPPALILFSGTCCRSPRSACHEYEYGRGRSVHPQIKGLPPRHARRVSLRQESRARKLCTTLYHLCCRYMSEGVLRPWMFHRASRS